jgi:crotonobetainyl-CoA:carnitine CoA-transferase CaiB-like acyl-CoA transferase
LAAASDFAAGPLGGIRVLDLSRVLAGPYAGRLFRDLGAEVIKLEPPEGDESRQIAPRHDRGQSWLFTFSNVGKRSISLDLGKPGASDVVLALARLCDVVIENFPAGVLERLGIGWGDHAANPRGSISISGFGSTRRSRAPRYRRSCTRRRASARPRQLGNARAAAQRVLDVTRRYTERWRCSRRCAPGDALERRCRCSTPRREHSESGNVLLAARRARDE